MTGHPLARVVGAGPCGIVAVIGGEQHQVVGAQRGEDRADFGVEPFEVARIARHVAAVAVEAVELDEIGEGQAAVLGIFHMPARWVIRSASAPLT
jgi:hypothetical protein